MLFGVSVETLFDSQISNVSKGKSRFVIIFDEFRLFPLQNFSVEIVRLFEPVLTSERYR